MHHRITGRKGHNYTYPKDPQWFCAVFSGKLKPSIVSKVWISILNKCQIQYSLAAKLTNLTTCAMWTNHGAQKSGAQKSISASKPGNCENSDKLSSVLHQALKLYPILLGYLNYTGLLVNCQTKHTLIKKFNQKFFLESAYNM